MRLYFWRLAVVERGAVRLGLAEVPLGQEPASHVP